MSDSPLDLDLKFLPDWLKEPEGKNPYADYQGEADSPGRGRGRRPFQGDRSERRDRPPRAGGGRGPGGPNAGPRSGPRTGPQGQGERAPRAGGRPDRGDRGRGPRRPDRAERGEPRSPQPPPPEAAVPLEVSLLPESAAVDALIQQIKTSYRAYPLYGVGRMFLNKPERHRVKIASLAPAYPVFRIGEDQATLNRRQAQNAAFRKGLETFYVTETKEIDPPKGNFTNVARCRVSGVLLGPTNHHGYQLALRRLYEARFSRRMSFPEFQRQIEVVNDAEVIEAWKKETSTTTVYRTRDEENPQEFKTLEEVEAHFQTHHLPTALSSDKEVEIGGVASRNLADRILREAIRAAWEKERTFPAQLVGALRPRLQEAGLQIWKHRKRMLFVSPVRPVRFAADSRSLSEEIATILNIIESKPKCTRADLSEQILKPLEGDESHAQRKASLASDFHWLLQSGHIIEFHDGTLDLPLVPKEPEKKQPKGGAKGEAKEGVAPVEAEALETEEGAAPEETTPVAEAPVAVAEAAPEVSEAVAEPVAEGVEETVQAESASEPASDSPAPEA